MRLRSFSEGIAAKVVLAVALLGLPLASATTAATEAKTVTQPRFGTVEVLSPDLEPSAFVVLMMDPNDATASPRAIADKLTSKGAAVAIIDQKAMQSVLTAPPAGETCISLFGDIEHLARLAERDLSMQSWRQPVLFGIGAGGTAAYLSMAQAPSNTAAGVVSLGFSGTLASKIPVCSGAPLIGSKDGEFLYGPTKLPGRWTIFTPDPSAATLAPFLNANPGAKAEAGSPGDDAALNVAIAAVFEVAAVPTTSLDDLPLTELPAKNPRDLVIFLSGDGGWRDIDKRIGEALSKEGVAVIGVDSLRYFWSKKDPSTIAHDIERIALHYREAWHVTNVSLAGYSFGAAAIPLAWPKLDPSLQHEIRLIALLGIEPVARLEMSMAGWLGLSSASDIGLRPFLAEMPKDRLMCVYSVDEEKAGSTACTLPELDGATRIAMTGGHHFGGAYQEIAQMILHRLNALHP
jgi:type IV secretory pathway VirJ component